MQRAGLGDLSDARDFARDCLDPRSHGGLLLRRQGGARTEESIPLLPKLGHAGALLDRLGLLPTLIMVAPKLEQVEPLLLGETGDTDAL